MTKQEFKRREALYKHLLELKVPEVLAELIAVRAVLRYVDARYGRVSTYTFWIVPNWDETPEGADFWRGVNEEALAIAKAGGAA